MDIDNAQNIHSGESVCQFCYEGSIKQFTFKYKKKLNSEKSINELCDFQCKNRISFTLSY